MPAILIQELRACKVVYNAFTLLSVFHTAASYAVTPSCTSGGLNCGAFAVDSSDVKAACDDTLIVGALVSLLPFVVVIPDGGIFSGVFIFLLI
jgi:hypothetical protein